MNMSLLIQAENEEERYNFYDSCIDRVQVGNLSLKELVFDLVEIDDEELSNGYLTEFIDYSTPYILI